LIHVFAGVCASLRVAKARRWVGAGQGERGGRKEGGRKPWEGGRVGQRKKGRPGRRVLGDALQMMLKGRRGGVCVWGGGARRTRPEHSGWESEALRCEEREWRRGVLGDGVG
jgi:hypothetical protein